MIAKLRLANRALAPLCRAAFGAFAAGLGVVCLIGSACAQSKLPVAQRLKIAKDRQITTLRLRMSQGVRVSVFTLPSPYRLILDLPETDFRLKPMSKTAPTGLLRDFRTGLVASGHSRIVFDIRAPFKLVDVRAERLANGQSDIRLDLGNVSASSFRAQGVPPRLPPAASLRQGVFDGNGPSSGPSGRRRHVIVLDPGHGGPDPGALSARGTTEKTVVLAVANRLARELRKAGKYKVIMTRKRDVFVSLDDRVKLSRQSRADLFISLHADALASRLQASKIRGGSIYTLARVASDRRAKELADKENATDALAGLPIAPAAARGRIEAILFDLMRRETADFSVSLRRHLVRRLQRSIRLSRSPERAAAFKVLQQPETPSVLIELGYMSNQADVREMTRRTWQTAAARAISKAVAAYFAERRK